VSIIGGRFRALALAELAQTTQPDQPVVAEHLLDPVQRDAANNTVLIDEIEHPAVFRVERDVVQIDADDPVRDAHLIAGGVTRGESCGRA